MTDLNDFFARKDKKKSKGLRFATVNEIDKKLQETDKKREKLQNKNQDSEWKEFEDKKKDYTGLKIQNTTLSEQVEEIEGDVNVLEETPCPWKITAPLQDTHFGKPEEIQNKEKESVHNSPEKYVPPHLRNKHLPGTTKRQRPRTAQGLGKEAIFPSLQAASSVEGSNQWVWEQMRLGEIVNREPHYVYNNPNRNHPMANKFKALRDHVE